VRISFTVNGMRSVADVPPDRLLTDLLRDDLGFTGTKEGCGIGVCGACTVLIDGQSVSACLTLSATVDGSEILTIEGLSEHGALHPLQQAFVDHAGFQCGFCTPGQVMAAYALLQAHPQPTDEDLKEGMLGNLCRCTGYYKIADSIRAAARGEETSYTADRPR
jgi:carbon-monoxide dehydrogenase small subunit